MTTLSAFSALTVLLLGVASLTLLWPHRRLNPLFLFAGISSFFSTTTVARIDFTHSSDELHASIIVAFNLIILAYIIFFYDYRKSVEINKKIVLMQDGAVETLRLTPVVLLLIISVAVSFAYFNFAVGYNLAFVSFLGGVEDFTSMRLAAYSGDTYTGAGLVNQFKNTILPISFFLVVMEAYRRGGLVYGAVLGILLLPVFVWCIAGTGQRAYLFFSVAGLLIFLDAFDRIRYVALIPLFVVFFVFFGYQSYSLGRTSGVSVDVILEQILARFGGDNQAGTIEGFRYIASQPIQFGSEWFMALGGLIPGVKGSDLAHRVHEYMFGTLRGTVPLALWVSIYHNVGFWLFAPCMFVFLKSIERVRDFFLKTRSVFHVMTFSFLSFYIGLMPISDPAQLINNGLPGVVFAIVFYGLRMRNWSLELHFRR